MTNEIVKLDGVSFPQEYTQFLRMCEELGFKNSVLIGGALRDSRLGVPMNDLDVLADYSNSPIFQDTPQAAAQNARAILSESPGITDVKIDDKFVDTPNRKGFRAFFSYNGQPVDIFVTQAPRPLATQLSESDAPINCVGMNARGEVFGHPKFLEHAGNRLYVPLPDTPAELAAKRFDHLQKKIPGLKRIAEVQNADQEVAITEEHEQPGRPGTRGGPLGRPAPR